MRKRLTGLSVGLGVALAGFALTTISASAGLSLEPGVYADGKDTLGPGAAACPGGGAVAAAVASGHIALAKEAETSQDCAAFVVVNGIGTGINVTELSFDWQGQCGAGAPRWNVTTKDGKVHFFGCQASDKDGHVSIDPSNATLDGSGNGGVAATDTVTDLAIIFDEKGATTLSNVDVNGEVISAIVSPTPTPSATPAPTATPRPTATPATLARTGGAGSSGSGWALLVLGGGALAGGLAIWRRRGV